MKNRIILIEEAQEQIDKIITALEIACKGHGSYNIESFQSIITENLSEASLDCGELTNNYRREDELEGINDISDEELRIARIELGTLEMD